MNKSTKSDLPSKTLPSRKKTRKFVIQTLRQLNVWGSGSIKKQLQKAEKPYFAVSFVNLSNCFFAIIANNSNDGRMAPNFSVFL